MIALIILFVSGLLSLFIAFTKKPWTVLMVASAGLIASAVALVCEHTCSNMLQFDGLEFTSFAIFYGVIAIIFAFLIILTAYSSFKDTPEHTGDYIGLLIFSLTGAIIMFAFTDMFLFFLGLEILSIPVYVMAGSKKSDIRSSEASLKYFLTGAFSTGVVLFGIAWVYGGTGSFNLKEINTAIMAQDTASPLIYVGMLMIMASFLFKIGATPFHFWSPDVYDGSPVVVTGFMATIVKLAGFAAFLKMFNMAFGSLHDFWAPALGFIAVITMFVGNLSAIKQTRFKRLLAYSSIAHVGYALLTLVMQSPDSPFNLMAYLFAYGFSVIALVTVVLIINDDEDQITSFKGLARRNPFVGFVAVVALLSMAGVPPLMGFFGKYLVFAEAIYEYPILVAIALLNSGIGVYYYLRIVILTVQKPEEGAPYVAKHKVPALQWFVLAVCAAAILFGGNMLIF